MKQMGRVIAAMTAAGCVSDITIRDPGLVQGVPNSPDLATPVQHDQITQITTPKVDILWVIDDSCSMAEEQAQLVESFPAFMQFFVDSGLDWHVGVVSTDTTDSSKNGKLQGAGGYKYLDPDSPDPVALFGDMASLGISGSYEERGRRATDRALTDPLLNGFNSGFYRDEASLSIIVISDEPDASSDNPTINEFIAFLNNLKEDEDLVDFSSVVAPLGGCPTASFPGGDYLAVTDAVGGIAESICSEDWVPVLEALGLQASGLRREYFLSELPVPGTLDVWVVDGDFQYNGIDRGLITETVTAEELCPTSHCFTYDYNAQRNSILMEEYVPSPLAEINIRYDMLKGYQPGEGENPLTGGGGDTGL